MSGSNPKFLNVESKVQFNMRVPKRLIDKYTAYAELSGNTTTNIIINVLDEFIADKVVINDYLDNPGGVTVKIPYALNQKHNFINDCWNLKEYAAAEKLTYYFVDERHDETYFAELFEIKKISNNLDIYVDDSYVANKKILKFNHNAIHSGIELFIYNITEIIFADHQLIDKIDSFINCLYCLYFEVSANDDVNVYLIDYLTAINLLSASGNDNYKDLIIAAATELSDVDNVVNSYNDDFTNAEIEIAEKYLHGDHADNGKYIAAVRELDDKLKAECKAKCDELVDVIADGYNSNNIIRFGTDIFSRLAIKEIKSGADIDDIINEKIDAAVDERINEIHEKIIGGIDDDKLKRIYEIINESNENKTNK